MPSNLIERLPGIWKSLDSEGFLGDYVGVFDGEFDRITELIKTLIDYKSAEKINNFYLYLLSNLIGHTWRSDLSRDWNRGGIRNAIARHSYKGTYARVHDLVIRNGGSYWEHTDMCSQIIVPGSQGYLGGQSSYLMGATLYHPGAHRFYINEEVRNDDFEDEMELIRPAAEVWYLYYISSISPTFELDFTDAAPEAFGEGTSYSSGEFGGAYLARGYLGSFWFDPFDSFCVMEFELVEVISDVDGGYVGDDESFYRDADGGYVGDEG